MKKSIERATSILAVTATLAASSAEVASAETAPQPSPNQARATKLARKITKDLYDTADYPKGVPVPGILNGTVEVDVKTVSGTYTGGYENPIVLVRSHPAAATEKNGKLLNGSWIGIPSSDAEGHVNITPTQIKLGEHNHETVSLHLADSQDTVLDGAGVYAVPAANGPDQLYGFDIQNGDSGKFPIEADGMK